MMALQQGRGIRCLFITLADIKVERYVRLKFKISNDKTEYEATYTLRVAKYLGAMRVQLLTDSKLIVNQSNGLY